MGCEFREGFSEFWENIITKELAGVKNPDDGSWYKVQSVVARIATSKYCEQITPEDANRLYKEIIRLHPQFEERLREALDIPSTASPQP